MAVSATRARVGCAGWSIPSRHAALFDAGDSHLARYATRFDVVEVKPYGGKARELWFDRRSHLLGRIVDRSGPRPVTVSLSDYRRVGPVQVAIRFTVEGAPGQDRQVESLTFQPADRDRFGLPRP